MAHRLRIHSITSTQASKSGYVYILYQMHLNHLPISGVTCIGKIPKNSRMCLILHFLLDTCTSLHRHMYALISIVSIVFRLLHD